MASATLRWALNVFCVTTSCVCKLPQMRLALGHGAEAVDAASLALETASLTVTMCYFYYYSYPWADYLEYPVLVLQNLVLFAIVAVSGNVSVRKAASAVVGYATAVTVLCSGIIPSLVINLLSSLVTPTSTLSKLVAMRSIVSSGRGDLVSRLPWTVFALTSLARIYTVSMESADTILLVQYTVSVVMNVAVVAVAVIYTPTKVQKE